MSEFSEMMKERPKTVRIIGVGRAGINVAKYWRNEMGGERADKFVAVCDWDSKAIEQSGVSAALRLDECTVWPGIECGAEAVEKRIDDVRELVNAREVAVVVGLGGIFGTEAAPIIAREAKAAGASTVGVATLPFEHEGTVRVRRALDGLRELAANCDAMFILNNESMLKYYGKLLVPDAMARIDSIMSNSIDIIIDHTVRWDAHWQNIDTKVVGIGRVGADLIDYLLKRKYRKKLLATFKPTNNNTAESGNMEPLQIILGDGKTPDLDGIMQYFGSQDSPVCVVADLGEDPEAKSAPFVARVARQMGATVVGLVILPAVSDGAAKCAKAIETLQNLAANTDAVYAYRSDIYSGIGGKWLAFDVIHTMCANRLIKEARPNESETQNKNGDADSRKVEAN